MVVDTRGCGGHGTRDAACVGANPVAIAPKVIGYLECAFIWKLHPSSCVVSCVGGNVAVFNYTSGVPNESQRLHTVKSTCDTSEAPPWVSRLALSGSPAVFLSLSACTSPCALCVCLEAMFAAVQLLCKEKSAAPNERLHTSTCFIVSV